MKDKDLIEVVWGAGLALFIKVWASFAAFILSLLLTRNLGARESGFYFLGITLITILSAFCRYGYDNVLVKEVAKFKEHGQSENIKELHKYITKRVLLGSIIVSILGHLFSEELSIKVFQKPEFRPVLEYFFISLPPFTSIFLLTFCYQGLKKILWSSLFQNSLLYTFLIICFLFWDISTAVEVSQLFCVATILLAIVSLCIWWKLVGIDTNREVTADFALINQSRKVLFSIVVMNFTISCASQLFLGIYSSVDEVAYFATAERTATLISFFLIAINAITAPKYAEMYSNNDFEGIKKIAIFSTRMITVITIPMILGICLFSEKIMGLFGEEFKQAAPLLIILSLGQFINVMTGSVGYLLQMTDNEKVYRKNIFCSFMITLIGGPIIIPVYGLIGAAVVTAVAMACTNLLSVIEVKKALGFNTMTFWQKV